MNPRYLNEYNGSSPIRILMNCSEILNKKRNILKISFRFLTYCVTPGRESGGKVQGKLGPRDWNCWFLAVSMSIW